jgi:hypothetical protein
MSFDGADHLGVGDDGTLWWDGKPVVVRRGVSLTWWQTAIAVVAAAGAFASGLIDVLTFLRN